MLPMKVCSSVGVRRLAFANFLEKNRTSPMDPEFGQAGALRDVDYVQLSVSF